MGFSKLQAIAGGQLLSLLPPGGLLLPYWLSSRLSYATTCTGQYNRGSKPSGLTCSVGTHIPTFLSAPLIWGTAGLAFATAVVLFRATGVASDYRDHNNRDILGSPNAPVR